MSCCNNVTIQRQTDTGCACVFRCGAEDGARVLGSEVTITEAPSGPEHFIPGTPVVTTNGVDYTVMGEADLHNPDAIGYGIVSCGAPASNMYPLTFTPEIVTAGDYWTDLVAYPAELATPANKKALVALFRAHGLEGVGVYA